MQTITLTNDELKIIAEALAITNGSGFEFHRPYKEVKALQARFDCFAYVASAESEK